MNAFEELDKLNDREIRTATTSFFVVPDAVEEFTASLRRFFFPEYTGEHSHRDSTKRSKGVEQFLSGLRGIIHPLDLGDTDTAQVIENMKQDLPKLREMLWKDVEAAYAGDPAAVSYQEIILTYPGFFSIMVQRFAHLIWKQGIPLLPRMLTEFAHSKTGIDIHPGAHIGESFFIDHGTGIVIGETAVIGSHVKIYQGVTLGALSTSGGQRLKCRKRHPTVQDFVTIYAGASILGGETVIGEYSVIGSNTFITESVPSYTRVTPNKSSDQYICNSVRRGRSQSYARSGNTN